MKPTIIISVLKFLRLNHTTDFSSSVPQIALKLPSLFILRSTFLEYWLLRQRLN
ncbi:hypothetical protein J41TS12_17560 [Paenibacillus antibioticophila]|uniref:Uncharacterized protein n=1 Tax=Paenibacillus antibioticophila TaxID=1274374 RepID=A0A920CER7_9BACL|nr:hypothetical protein J41TS12_17560 [Paenibacillus antibioticophila]